MKYSLSYGQEALSLELSSLSNHTVYEAPQWKELAPPGEIIQNALANPIGSPSLEELLITKKPKSATIVLSDVTRVTGSNVFVPALREILSKQVKPENITWLVAAGIHPPCSHEQIKGLLGLPASAELKDAVPPYSFALPDGSSLVQHNGKDASSLVSMGRIKGGEELLINRCAAEADFLIITGTITYHYLAGFGGGRKSVLPGISSYQSCIDLHKISIDEKNMRKHPDVTAGKMCKNPMNKHIVKAVELVQPDFLLNTVCNERKEMVYAVAGDWKDAFKKGRRFVKKHFSQKIKQKHDAAIISCGGFPKDINVIQSHKSYENCINLVKEGGSLLLIAECAEGTGNQTFLNWFANKSEEEFIKNLLKNFEINGQTALAVFLKSQRVKTSMITSLDKDIVETMNMRKVASIEEFIEQENLIGKSVAIVPHGSTTYFRDK